MSKKDKSRKNRHGCLKACCGFMIVCLVLVVAVGAVGVFFGNKLLQSNFGTSVKEVVGIVSSAKGVNEKKIVKNKFSAKDVESAEDSISSALYLKDSANFDLDKIFDILFEPEQLSGGAITAPNSMGAIYAAEGEEGEPKNEKWDKVLEYFESIMTYENIDVEKFRNYSAENINEFNFKLTDKELAALISKLAERFLTSKSVTDGINEAFVDLGLSADDIAIEDNFRLKQIVFDEKDGIDRVKLTLCFNLFKVFDTIIDKADYLKIVGDATAAKGVKIGAKLVSPLIKAFLPKKIYITGDFSLKEGEEVHIYLNEMSQKEMNKAFDLIKKLTENTGEVVDIKQKINEPFMEGGEIYNALKKFNEEYVNLAEVFEDGRINVDLAQLLIDVTKINYDEVNGELIEKENKVDSEDFYNALSLMYGTSVADVLGENGTKTSFDYNNIKFLYDENGNILTDENGMPRHEYVYQYSAVLLDQGKDITDQYEKAFLQEMSTCYGLKADITFDDLLDIFSEEEGAAENALSMFDTQKLKDIIKNGGRGGLISDTMLSAIVDDRLTTFLGEENADYADKLDLKYLILSTDANEHTFAELGICISIADWLDKEDGNDTFLNIIKNVLPESFVVSVKMDVTFGATEFAKSVIRINDSSRTDAVIDFIDALGVLKDGEKEVTLTDFIDEVLTPIREVLTNMSDTLPGLSLGTSKIVLPDIYGTLAAFINAGAEENEKIDTALLTDALRVLISDIPQNPYSALTAENFKAYGDALINELNSKLAIKKTDENGNAYTLKNIVDKLGLGESQTSSDLLGLIDCAQLENIVGATEISGAVMSDSTSEADMIAALVREVIGEYLTGDTANYFGAENILGTKIEVTDGKTFVTLIAKINIADMLGQASGDAAATQFILDLLPTEIMLSVKVEVTPNASSYAETDIKYNFSEDSDKVLQVIEKLGVTLPITDIEASVRSAITSLTQNEAVEISLVNGGIATDNIFGVINGAVFKTALSDAEIKSVLKGIYKSSDTKIATYFADNNITVNAPATNYSEFLSQVNQKYFIKTQLTTFDQIFDIVSAAGDTLHPSVFDLDALKHTALEISELKPTMTYGEMGALFNEKLAGTITVSSINYAKTTSRNLVFYAKINLRDYITDDADIVSVLGVSQVMASVTVNLDSVLTSGNDKYYATSININGMTADEYADFVTMITALNANFGSQIDSIAVDAGKSVYQAFSALDGNLGGNYQFTDGGVVVGDVFSFIGYKMLGVAEDHDAQALKVRKAIQGLYEKSDTNSKYNYAVSDFLFNPIETAMPSVTLDALKNGITDRQLGAYAQIKIGATNNPVGQIVQFNLLPATHDGGKVAKDIAYVNGFKANTITTGDYIMMTMKIKLSDLVEASQSVMDLLPDEVYVSAVLKFDVQNSKFVCQPYFRINGMDAEAENTMFALCGISEESVTDFVMTNSDKCVKPVNDLFTDIGSQVGALGGSINHIFTEIKDDTTCRGKYSVTVGL